MTYINGNKWLIPPPKFPWSFIYSRTKLTQPQMRSCIHPCLSFFFVALTLTSWKGCHKSPNQWNFGITTDISHTMLWGFIWIYLNLFNYIIIKININVKDNIYKITKAKYIFFVKIFKKNQVIFLFSQKNIFLSVRSIVLFFKWILNMIMKQSFN
jgi:hypothetical protein